MCRNIKPLFNYDPPATNPEINDAATQFVRKLSGMNKPSAANQAAFDTAVHDIQHTISQLLNSLTTSATPRDRQIEAERAKLRASKRFA